MAFPAVLRSLAHRQNGHHIGDMSLASVVRKAIRANPASMRALAREAGISHALLLRILTNERAVTRDVAERLAAALDRWGSDCTQAADSIRNATERERGK